MPPATETGTGAATAVAAEDGEGRKGDDRVEFSDEFFKLLFVKDGNQLNCKWNVGQ